VNVSEVEDICSVFWDVLDVALDVMFCVASVLQSLHERFHVEHGVDRLFLVFLQGVDPDVDVMVYLTSGEFAQFRFLRCANFPL
jgi:hypothetical protein